MAQELEELFEESECNKLFGEPVWNMFFKSVLEWSPKWLKIWRSFSKKVSAKSDYSLARFGETGSERGPKMAAPGRL
jgi:hypothetical protein